MKPLVLLTNDDGYDSPGIIELASHLIDDFEILLVAPQIHHSGSGRSVPFGASYTGQGSVEKHTIEVAPGKNLTAYAVDGTPALSVAHAILEIVPRKPDLCISGINFGENIGQALHYSGTIGAAMEAAAAEIPTIAMSQEMDLEDIFNFEGQREIFTAASLFAKRFALELLEQPMEANFVCLNVNVPKDATVDTPVEITRQSAMNRWVWTRPGERDLAKPFQLVCENDGRDNWEPGTDTYAVLTSGHVSITPLSFSMEAREGEVDEQGLKRLL